LDEPAADLSIVAAIASSLTDTPLDPRTLLIGEIGLVGEIRAVSHPVPRLKEAVRHGFQRIIAPMACVQHAPPGAQVTGVRTVGDALSLLFSLD
jgi:DNA repair protein RadA/Sms